MFNRVNSRPTVSVPKREETASDPATPKTRNISEVYASTSDLATRGSADVYNMTKLRSSLPSEAYQAAEKKDPQAAQAAQNLLHLGNWKR